MSGPSLVFIISDGIRGHVNQSRGLALWLARNAGAVSHELEAPRLSGMRRFIALKVKARALTAGDPKAARRWLEDSGGAELMEEASRILGEAALPGQRLLCLSTGSTAAPFSLALARLLGARAATVMTPSVLGTRPFDFAIVPAHDSPPPRENVFRTLGAPNAIDEERLAAEAKRLFSRFPPHSPQRWGILVGGDDANYRISADWIRERIGRLALEALEAKADLYVTTSRRTSPEAERALVDLAAGNPVFRMILLASKDPANPVPGLLGGCEAIYCTEDSVSMVSEAATAGFTVRLLRVGRKGGPIGVLQKTTSWLVEKRFLPNGFLWGSPRFDAMLEGFKARGLAREVPSSGEPGFSNERGATEEFNEARDAAAWILREWEGKAGGSR